MRFNSRDGRTRNGFSERRELNDLRQRIGDDAGSTGTFDFLGFTHYCAKTRKGRFRLGRKPSAKRMNRTLRRVGERLWRQRHADHWEVGKWLSRVLNGWLNYFAVPGSTRSASAIGCNGDGCERCGAGPSVTASVGDGCDG